MRDAKGRYVRRHLYRLVFDDGHNEDVLAYSPSEAVLNRKGSGYRLLPHTITDLTAIAEWREALVLVLDRSQPMPLMDRLAHTYLPAIPANVPVYQRPDNYWQETWDD